MSDRKQRTERRRIEWIVGSSPDCDIVVPADHVDPHHCRLTMKAGVIFVDDLNSTNGTYVDGQRTTGRTRVSRSANVTLGRNVRIPKRLPHPSASSRGNRPTISSRLRDYWSRWRKTLNQPTGRESLRFGYVDGCIAAVILIFGIGVIGRFHILAMRTTETSVARNEVTPATRIPSAEADLSLTSVTPPHDSLPSVQVEAPSTSGVTPAAEPEGRPPVQPAPAAEGQQVNGLESVWRLEVVTPDGETYVLGTAVPVGERIALTSAEVVNNLRRLQAEMEITGQLASGETTFGIIAAREHPDFARRHLSYVTARERAEAQDSEFAQSDDGDSEEIPSELLSGYGEYVDKLTGRTAVNVGVVQVDGRFAKRLQLAEKLPGPGSRCVLQGLMIRGDDRPAPPSTAQCNLLTIDTCDKGNRQLKLMSLLGPRGRWSGSVILDERQQVVGVLSHVNDVMGQSLIEAASVEAARQLVSLFQ